MDQDQQAAQRRRRQRRAARAIGLFLTLVGLVNLATALDPDFPSRVVRLESALGLQVRAGTVGSVVAATVLLLVGRQLVRGKRVAWWVAVAAAAVVVAGHVVGRRPVLAILPALALGMLVSSRDAFPARPDPASRRRLLWLPALVAFDVAFGAVGLGLHRVRHGATLSVPDVVVDSVRGLVGLSLRTPVRSTFATVFSDVLVALGLLTAAWALFELLRPVLDRTPAPDDDALRSVVGASGGTLDYFLLRDDKRVVRVGGAALGYRYLSGVGLATGDPVGDPAAATAVFEAFVAECDQHGWRPAVVGTHERFRTAWEAAGLSAVTLGDEAVLQVADLRLSGRDRRSLRQAVNRIGRSFSFDLVAVADLPPPERAELRHLSDRWLGFQPERGFAMALGRIADPRDGGVLVARARRDTDGELAAFLQLVPCERGYSLDVMRRTRAAPNGLHDYLIVRTAEALAEHGLERLSLNFAVMRSLLAAGVVLPWWQRPVVPVLRLLSRWFQIESLYRFNAKFDPDWEPRVLVYRDPDDLPTVAIAALQAEAFLPRFGRRRR